MGRFQRGGFLKWKHARPGWKVYAGVASRPDHKEAICIGVGDVSLRQILLIQKAGFYLFLQRSYWILWRLGHGASVGSRQILRLDVEAQMIPLEDPPLRHGTAEPGGCWTKIVHSPQSPGSICFCKELTGFLEGQGMTGLDAQGHKAILMIGCCNMAEQRRIRLCCIQKPPFSLFVQKRLQKGLGLEPSESGHGTTSHQPSFSLYT